MFLSIRQGRSKQCREGIPPQQLTCQSMFNHCPQLLSCSAINSALGKTFSNVFTSPSSSEAFVDADENGAARKKQRTASNSQKKATKRNVATILGMDGQVTPRSIAYAAVLVSPFFRWSSSQILCLLITASYSWPLIYLTPLTGWRSTMLSTIAHYTR